MSSKPKILLLDIETSPLITYTWGLYDQNIGLNQVKKESNILAWSAKWLDGKEMFYHDQENVKDMSNEKEILRKLWKLLDEADVVIGHNVRRFDLRRINGRFLKYELGRPSDYRIIDTLSICRKNFDLLSNKLEWVAEYLKCKNRKLTKRKFAGMSLWIECLDKNPEAWIEMEQYNKQDVIVLEEVYKKLRVWDDSINFSVYNEGKHMCSCGSCDLIKKGPTATNTGIFQRYKCKKCGKPFKTKVNELTAEQKKQLKTLGKEENDE